MSRRSENGWALALGESADIYIHFVYIILEHYVGAAAGEIKEYLAVTVSAPHWLPSVGEAVETSKWQKDANSSSSSLSS